MFHVLSASFPAKLNSGQTVSVGYLPLIVFTYKVAAWNTTHLGKTGKLPMTADIKMAWSIKGI